MQASITDNEFVGVIPGMDCKSEWLLTYGRMGLLGEIEDHELEVTLIIKLDKDRPDLITFLREEGFTDWYVFFDGKLLTGYGEGSFVDEFATIRKRGRYLLAYIPFQHLTAAVKRGVFDGELGSGLIMTSSLHRKGPPFEPPKEVDQEDQIICERGTVVMGIIDDGIAVAHERFRVQGGEARVRFLWDQRERGQNEPVRSLPYGREILGSDIEAIKDGDEDSFYRKNLTELSDPNNADSRLLRSATHGTHVLDLAAGQSRNSQSDEPDQKAGMGSRPIIAVQLPPVTVADTSGISFSEQYVMSGLLYILSRAKRFQIKTEGTQETKPAPVVINFSFGTIAGPHDGTHQLERLFDEAVYFQESKDQILRMVVPAGNSHQSRCHAEFAVGHQESTELRWRLQPDDQTPNWLHVWLPPGSLSDKDCPFEITITSPSGESIGQHALPTSKSIKIFEGTDANTSTAIGLVTYTLALGAGDKKRGHLCIALSPTSSLEAKSNCSLAPHGVWRISLSLRSELPATGQPIEAWIERDDSVMGHRASGRQSYFDHDDYERFDVQGRPITEYDGSSIVKREGLINAIATGRNTITVGAARGDNNRPSSYSAGGPLHHTNMGTPTIDRADRRRGVDLLAIADDSAIHGGIIAAGTYSGSSAVLNGTSVAAPQVARMVADDLALGRTKSLSELRSRCLATIEDETRSGFGTVDGRRDQPRRREVD